ncbi:MAG: Holliday junction resolvase RuvX [Actinobacteria bacterium]|nr:Holliday junction resolvase RuvX [Actinomycetota bacterium]
MILGIDPGERRIGVAVADRETRFARPVEVIDSKLTDPIARIVELVSDMVADLVVVGRPVSMSGSAGASVDARSGFVEQLRNALEVDVVEHDERLTTVVAQQGLKAAGGRAKARKKALDAVAAQVMLQGFLDSGGGER